LLLASPFGAAVRDAPREFNIGFNPNTGRIMTMNTAIMTLETGTGYKLNKTKKATTVTIANVP
jgi:hypothetical protein